MPITNAEASALKASIAHLNPCLQELVERATQVAENAYAPFSNFHVGAAILTEAGNTYTGCNVENASFGISMCAERNAVFAAVTAEGSDTRITAVAVHVDDANGSSCGACRQALAEFGPDAEVAFPLDGAYAVMTVRELLPVMFELRADR